MPKLKALSGKELVKFFNSFGFSVERQKGSHVILLRAISGQNQCLVIPNHSEIDRGTAREIFRQARVYIAETELRKFFYTD